jgi:hypothetical protein
MSVAKRTGKCCSSCGLPRDKPGQAMCKACHRKYMRTWRKKHVYVLREDVKG